MALDVRRIRAVIFDMDDTLIGWRQAEQHAIQDLAELLHAERSLPPDGTRDVYAAVMAENIRSFKATGRWWFVEDRLRLLAKRLEVPDDWVRRMAEGFLVSVRQNLHLLPGATQALTAARRLGRTALLTNGHQDVQRPKVERFEFDLAVDFVGITGEIGKWKPDVAAFEHVMQILGVPAHATLMVGDSVPFDLEPAKFLGMQTCRIDPDGQDDPSADLVVPDPGGLADILAGGHDTAPT